MYGSLIASVSAQQIFYISGSTTPVSTDWDFDASDSYVSQMSPFFGTITGGTRWTGGDISADGVHLIAISDSPDNINYFTCSVAHDLRTAEHSGTRGTLQDMGGSPNGQDIRFGDNGDRVFVADLGVDGIHSWTLSASYDFQSAAYEHYYNPSETSGELAVDFNNDGTLMFIGRFGDDEIFTYELSSAWNIDSASYLRRNVILEAAGNLHFISFYNSGSDALIQDPSTNGKDTLVQWTLSTEYDFSSTVTKTNTKDMYPVLNSMYGVQVKQEQKYIFCSDYNKDNFKKIRNRNDDTYNTGSGNYYEFDGTSYSQGITSFPMTSLKNNMTILIRARLDETGSSATFSDFAGGTASNYLRWHYRDSTNELYVQFYDGTNTSNLYAYTWANDGDWHQFAVTYDTGSGVQILVDGVEEGSNADTDFLGWSGSIDNSENLYLGIRYKGGSIFYGAMSDVQVYDYKLSGTDLSDLNTDITDLPTVGPVMNLHTNKGTYCWQDDTANNYYAGMEATTFVEI